MPKQVNLEQSSHNGQKKAAEQSKANPYLRSQVMTASPEELVNMLFAGAIKFINLAIAAIEEKDMEKAHVANVRAQNIVLELMGGLNQEYEISEDFFKMYEFIHYHLITANSEKSTDKLKEAAELTRELRDTWKQAIEEAKSS
ncbi:MAG: flagellar export chaperone FliS [Tindallia sp. MSAO_Bac2]|nr:MAG: flagellar export chaperone FliS [Tindallia sp. MSAO_Bac2]